MKAVFGNVNAHFGNRKAHFGNTKAVFHFAKAVYQLTKAAYRLVFAECGKEASERKNHFSAFGNITSYSKFML